MPVRDERKNRDLHLEKKHVYKVYDQIAPKFSEISQKAWPNVRRFLKDLLPGSLVADIGCGSGRYLHINNKVHKVGIDICCPLVEHARNKGHEVLVSDNLNLPFRHGIFDAVISIGVIHHFSTQERRLDALKEMCHLLRPGGQIMIYVWAFEQKHRTFDGQDILIPWHGHKLGRTGSLSTPYRDTSSTTSSTSEEDLSQETSNSSSSANLLERSLSTPINETVSSETSVQSYVKSISRKNGHLSLSRRSNTLPCSLEGLSKDVPSALDTSSNIVAAECRKFEASMNAMSASMFYLSDEENSMPGDGQMKTLKGVNTFPHLCNNGDKFPLAKNKYICNLKSGFFNSDECHRKSKQIDADYTDLHKQSKSHHQRQNLAPEKGAFRRENDISDKKYSNRINSNDDPLNDSLHYKFECDVCPTHTSTSSHNILHTIRRKSSRSENKVQKKKDQDTPVKNKSIFTSLKESFLSLIEGKSAAKKAKISNSVVDLDQDMTDLSEFAVREFPLSSCPNYRKEITKQDRSLEKAKVINTLHIPPEKNMHNSNSQCGSCNTLWISGQSRTVSGHLRPKTQDITNACSPSGKNFEDDVFLDNLSHTNSQSCTCISDVGSTPAILQPLYNRLSSHHSTSLPTVHDISKPRTQSVPSLHSIKQNSKELCRFYHVFKDGELPDLISKHIPSVKVIRSTYDHANWCIVAEKLTCEM